MEKTEHHLECMCDSCEQNQTGYFGQWEEKRFHLRFEGKAELCLTYHKQEKRLCSASLQLGKIEILFVPPLIN